jgi:hypothetical protein
MVKGDWDKIQRFMVEQGRKPEEMSKVYSNFVYVLKKGERPEAAAPISRRSRGWTCRTGGSSICSARPRSSPRRSAPRRRNLGGCEHIVLNPLDWGMEQLELLAAEVLPRVAAP